MLKSQVGYSINQDSFMAGVQTAQESTKNLPNSQLGFLLLL